MVVLLRKYHAAIDRAGYHPDHSADLKFVYCKSSVLSTPPRLAHRVLQSRYVVRYTSFGCLGISCQCSALAPARHDCTQWMNHSEDTCPDTGDIVRPHVPSGATHNEIISAIACPTAEEDPKTALGVPYHGNYNGCRSRDAIAQAREQRSSMSVNNIELFTDESQLDWLMREHAACGDSIVIN